MMTTNSRKQQMCENYLCTKDQCSQLRNRGVMHTHTTALAHRAAYVTGIYLTLAHSTPTANLKVIRSLIFNMRQYMHGR